MSDDTFVLRLTQREADCLETLICYVTEEIGDLEEAFRDKRDRAAVLSLDRKLGAVLYGKGDKRG